MKYDSFIPKRSNKELAQMAGAKSAPTVVGSFSKGTAGSIALNYSEGSDENCDDSCPLKDGKCYTINFNKMKPSMAVSGERKRKMGFEAVICAQYWNIRKRLDKGESITWTRFSAFGSVPNRKLTGVEKTYLRILVMLLIDNDVPIHLPVESEFKRSQLEQAFEGLPIAVRLSTHGDTSKAGPKSVVVGTAQMKRAERLAEAERVRKEFKGTAVVCPAIKSTFNRTKPIKCGDCTACSKPNIELVIYPMH